MISNIFSASSPYKIEFILSKFAFNIKFILASAFGIFPRISLNSFMNGGKIKTVETSRNRDKNIITIRSDKARGSLNLVLT